MGLKARLSTVRRQTVGLPTLADQFKGVSDADIRRDVASARVGKTMHLSGRDVDAEQEIKIFLAA